MSGRSRTIVLTMAIVAFLLVFIVRFVVSSGVAGQTASIEGHWEAPEGGLSFDASGELCQLNIMHTFMYGRWKTNGAGSISIQFYDVTTNPAVLDSPQLRTTGRVGTVDGRREFDLRVPENIRLPGNDTLSFQYLGPTSEDFSDVEYFHHKR